MLEMDLDALFEHVHHPRLMAKPANLANEVVVIKSSLAKSANLAVSQETDEDADRCNWPNSPSMNGFEVDRFIARITRFADFGFMDQVAEHLADRLITRDRDLDAGVTCVECGHTCGFRARRCGNFSRAGMGVKSLPEEMIIQVQRCPGFEAFDVMEESHEN